MSLAHPLGPGFLYPLRGTGHTAFSGTSGNGVPRGHVIVSSCDASVVKELHLLMEEDFLT